MMKEKIAEKIKELEIEKARESEKAMWKIPPKIAGTKNKGFRMNNLFFIPTNDRVDYGAILARKKWANADDTLEISAGSSSDGGLLRSKSACSNGPISSVIPASAVIMSY